MKSIYSFLLLFISLTTYAQFGSPESFDSDYVKFSTLAVATDVNGDGWKDVISYSPDKGYIVWTEYYPCDSVWGMPEVIFQSAYNISHLDSEDLDGDGKVDLIVSSDEKSQIMWFQNIDGTGIFSDSLIIVEGIEDVPFFELDDLDKDGDIDLLTVAPTTQEFIWLENTGSGTFSDKKILSNQFPGAKRIRTADIDGDDDLDIIGATDNEILWFENFSSSASFSDAVLIDTFSGITELVISDINQDNHLDILVGSNTQQEINWYENSTDSGLFKERNQIARYTEISQMATGDFDQDGDEDLFVAGLDDLEQLVWFENQADHSFELRDTLSTLKINSFNLSDMNNDNLPDILMSGYLDRDIVVFQQTGLATDFEQISVAYRIKNICGIWSGDLDGDGHVDAITVADKIRYHKNLGYGDFKFKRAATLSAGAGRVFHNCLVADMDDDDDMDILYVDSQNGVGIFRNDNGVFDRDYLRNGSSMDIGDIDGDGDLDVVCAYYRIHWLENIDGDFDTEYDLDLFTSEPGAVKLGDFDNDGDLDVFCFDNKDIFWCENLDGKGTFGAPEYIVEDVNLVIATEAEVGDIDGDGDLDVVYSTVTKLMKILNKGNQDRFTAPIVLSSINTSDFDLVDMDKDDDLDIVGIGEEVFWLANKDGAGIYEDLIPVSEIEEPIDLLLSANDFDNDGDIDVFGASATFSLIDARYFFIENYQIDTLTDNDQDGYYSNVDCDDENASINPCAIEIEDNGIDEDCDGVGGEIVIAVAEVEKVLYTIFPNPTQDILSIETSVNQPGRFKIINAAGQVFLEKENIDLSNFSINIKNIPSGLYFIWLDSDDLKVVEKMIKL